jgi:hypothetical protein
MPAKRALATLDQPPPTDIGPPKRISKTVLKAIELMIDGKAKTITEAADQVGLARETLSRNLSRPHVAEIMRQRVVKSLGMAAGRASAVKIDLMESDNAVVADRASSFFLGLLGIQPATSPSVNLNIEVKAGYVIDLSDDPFPTSNKAFPTELPAPTSKVKCRHPGRDLAYAKSTRPASGSRPFSPLAPQGY